MTLKQQIFELIDKVDDDQQLAAELGKLDAKDPWALGNLVSSWGPRLYERNARVFLPFIERSLNSWNARRVKNLKAWLDEAEANGHTNLYRTLLQAWLNEEYGWGEAAEQWERMLRDAFRSAKRRPERREVINQFNLWYDISDDLATALYRVDPVVAGTWVLERLDRLEWHDVVYEQLARVALENGDRDLYFELYRRTFTQEMWEEDVEEILANVIDPEELCAELDRRHLAADDTALKPSAYIKVLEARGEDSLPYLLKHIPNTWSWGPAGEAWTKVLAIAEENGWWNLWTTVVKTQSSADTFTQTVQKLLDSDWPEWRVAWLLSQIAGATFGWRDWKQPCPLDDETAIALHERFPQFLRGPYAFHLVMTRTWNRHTQGWTVGRYLELARRAMENDDSAIIDILAARGIEQVGNVWTREPVEGLDWYAQYFAQLSDEVFAERAVRVLLRLRPFEFLGRRLRRSGNPLFIVFFGEPDRYRSRLVDVGDLLETDNEEVRHLALRILLAAPNDEAVTEAARQVDHLFAYLLNESTRATRIAAFEALVIASKDSLELATRIESGARGALRLRRREYPRDRLIELIGRVIHRWPQLRREAEQPVVYKQEAS